MQDVSPRTTLRRRSVSAVMAVLLVAAYVIMTISLLFVIRLYTVVKTGQKQRPGERGPVAVLVVAGSGNTLTSIRPSVVFLLCQITLTQTYSHRLTYVSVTCSGKL